jgi:hypothetical protein
VSRFPVQNWASHIAQATEERCSWRSVVHAVSNTGAGVTDAGLIVDASSAGDCAITPVIRSANSALSMSRVRNAGSSDDNHVRSQADEASDFADCRRCRTSAPSKTLRRVSRARSCLPSRAYSAFFCASSCTRRCSMVRRVMLPSMVMIAISVCRASTCGTACCQRITQHG